MNTTEKYRKYVNTACVKAVDDNVGRVPPEAMPQLEKLARQAGARFVLLELTHEKAVKRGSALNLNMKWANVGVGKLHHACVLRFFLLDAQGQPVLATDSKADPRNWLPGEYSLTEPIQLPFTLQTGEYTLAVALVVPGGQLRPFRLAMDAPEREGRYEISKVKIE